MKATLLFIGPKLTAMQDLSRRISFAFGDAGIDDFTYFGHSYGGGLSVFSGESDIAGADRWITDEIFDNKYIKINLGATMSLYGCNAGTGENSVAQKLVDKTGATVYAFTSSTLGTTEKNRINTKGEATSAEYGATWPNPSKLYYFGVDGEGFKEFTKK